MSDRSGVGRRTVLKTAGTTLGALSLAGTGVVRSASEYDQVVNIVEAGADPTGEELIDDVVEEYNEDDTLLEFPEGRYLANDLIFYERNNFGIRAIGDATLVPGPDYGDPWIGGAAMEDFLFEGFTLDHTAENTSPSVGFSAYDGLVVRDIYKKGHHDGHETAFGFSIWNEDGSGFVENLRMPDGGQPETAVGVYVNTTGELTFRDCHVEGFGNNGIYASHSSGPVHVEGGTFKNNDVTQVRLGSPGSSITGATVVVDDPPEEHDNNRGVRVSDGPGPVTIDDCEIMMVKGEGGGGVVGAYSGGSFHLSNSRLYVGPDYTTVGSGGTSTSVGILVDEPTGVDDPGSRTIENTSVTGGGDDYGAVLVRRNDNTFENVCIHQTGSERDGFIFTEQSGNNVVTDTTVDVPTKAFAGDGAVETSDVDYEGSCPLPEPMSTEDEPATSEPTEPSRPAKEPAEPTQPSEPAKQPRPTSPTGAGSHPTYAVMGKDSGNPTATVYGNFKCPYTQAFVEGNLATIQDQFVETGRLNVRYRDLAYSPQNPDEPYLLNAPQNELVSQVALGVWEFEPESYWAFFDGVFANQDAIDWTSLDDLTQLMKTAGVRNYGKVRAFVDANWFEDPVHETTQAAADLGISFVPQLELDGDTIPPHHETEEVVDWIEAHL